MPHAQNTKPFCVAPWSSLVIEMDGHVYPCCQRTFTNEQDALGSIHKQSLLEIWQGQKLKDLREKNNFAPFCCYCQEMNDSLFSPKQYHNNFISGELLPPRLQYLGLKISNHCLSSCRTCNVHSSTAWLPDALKIDPKAHFAKTTTISSQQLIKELDPFINELQHIYLAGGEPLTEKTHLELLKFLLDKGRGDIQLHYNTSLVVPSLLLEQTIPLWKKFKKIHLGVSLDAQGEQAEYLRRGCQWNQVEKDIKLIKDQIPNIDLFSHVTVSLLNLYDLPGFLLYLFNKEKKIPNIIFSFLKTPEYYDVQNLPNEFKEKIKKHYFERINDINEKYKMSYLMFLKIVLNHVMKKDGPNRLKEFWKNTQQLDAIRNENFENTFPEYYLMLKPFINS